MKPQEEAKPLPEHPISVHPPTGSLKPWEDLTIADDYMFKLVMSHKRICKHLLEIILGIKIRELMEPKTEKAMKTARQRHIQDFPQHQGKAERCIRGSKELPRLRGRASGTGQVGG